MNKRIINIMSNSNFESKRTSRLLMKELEERGFSPTTVFSNEAELVVCIGGDGSFIKSIHKSNFSQIPFVGINTGHLGFYQEISPEEINTFIDDYVNKRYVIDELKLVEASIYTKNNMYKQLALNEIVLKAQHSKLMHINVFINRNHVEKFSGDGILVSTPSGSTAYNFSCGGSIIYPTLDAMQITPIAPVNSIAYRSILSSIVVPGDFSLSLVPEKRYTNSNILLVDGIENYFSGLKRVNFRLSHKTIKKIVFSSDSYWSNLKSKFL